MWEDPIVAEVRKVRKKLSAQFGNDVRNIFADLRKRQISLGDKLIRRDKKDSKIPLKHHPEEKSLHPGR